MLYLDMAGDPRLAGLPIASAPGISRHQIVVLDGTFLSLLFPDERFWRQCRKQFDATAPWQ